MLVSENLVSGKKSRFWFRKIWSQKKIMGFGYREFGLEKRISFGKFGIEKKVSVLVSENLVSEKESRYRFRSNFWYRHSVGQGGHLWDPMGPSGWFDESSDDS